MEGKILYYFVLLAVLNSQYKFVKSIRGQLKRSAEPYEFRFIVPILTIDYEYSLKANILCTGTLLSNYHILTSEHCFEDLEYNHFRVLIGSNDINNNGEFYPMWFMSFEQWATSCGIHIELTVNDIGIIKIYNSIPYRLSVPTLSRLWPTSRLYGLQVTVAGWGETDPGVRPDRLQVGNVTILSKTTCDSRTASIQGRPSILPPTFICTAADPFLQVTTGDSGGPIFRNGEIFGVNVGTTPKNRPSDFNPSNINVHVGVSYYLFFIDSILQM